MREVSACDFCGASGAGTYEVLPPEIDGGKRMVLCDDCRVTLGGIVQPLLDHVGDGDVEPDVGDVEPDVGGDTAGGAAPSGGASERGDTGGTDAGAASREANRGGESETADGGATADAGGGTGDAHAEGTGGGSAETDEDGAKMAATGAGTSSGVPRGYRKTVRFLENREFPMTRENAVSMTAEAYGLDEEAVHAAIDHAIKHDRLSEFDGELRKP